MAPEVRYADEHLVVIDKPSGIPTQADGGGRVPDLHGWVRGRWPDAVLHYRIEQSASGLVLFSRHQAIGSRIDLALRGHAIERHYVAVLVGLPDRWGERAIWRWPIDGTRARTAVWRLGSGGSGGCHLLAVGLCMEDAHFHQARLHAALAGTPISGDPRLGGRGDRQPGRLALHASSLHFEHPVTGRTVSVHAPLPADLAPLWAQAGGMDVLDERMHHG